MANHVLNDLCVVGQNRVKQFHARSAQYDQILKKNEQCFALLALTLSLCPAAQKVLDENVLNTLREK
jgi:translation initiation factor 3 subunit L